MTPQLVHFTVDTHLDSWSKSEFVQADLYNQRGLVEAWERYGVLVLQGSEDTPDMDDELYNAVSRLNQRSRKLWQEAIKDKVKFRRTWVNSQSPSVGWEQAQTLDDLDQSMIEKIELLCIGDETRAFFFGGIPERDKSRDIPDKNLEICRTESAEDTKAFRNARRLAEQDIRADSDIDEVWEERFKPLAEYAKKIVVIDGFAFKDAVSSSNELIAFLKRVNNCGAKRGTISVEVFTQTPSYVTNQAAFENITRLWHHISSRAIRKLTINIVFADLMKKFEHDRYVRFGSSVCRLGGGIGFLRQRNKVDKQCAYHMRRMTRDDKEREKILASEKYKETSQTWPEA